MPKIVNKDTGFVANASNADWSSGVYNKNIWSLQTPTPVATPAATPAPVAPTPANQISSQTLTAPNVDLVSQAKARDSYLTRIKDTYTKVGGDTLANDAFIQAVAQYKYGRKATADELAKVGTNQYGLVGSKVKDVLGRFGLLDKMDNFGIEKPQAPASPTNLPQDNANGQSGNNVPEAPKSSLDLKMEMANNYSQNIQAERVQAKQEAGVNDIQTAMNTAQQTADATMAKIESMKTNLEATDIINEEAQIALKNKIEGQAIPMSFINGQLLKGMNDLSQEQRMTRLYDVYELNANVNVYNAQLRNVQLLQGQYTQAMDNVKQSVDDWVTEQSLKMDILTEQGQLEKEERAKIESEIEYERGLMMEGYVYVENTDTYNKLVKQFGVNAGNFSNFFYKDPSNNKIYLKPDATLMASGGMMASGSGKKSGGGGSNIVAPAGQVSDLTQSIIDNPSLFDDLTPTKRAIVLEELQGADYDTSNLGTKGLSDTAIAEVAQTQKALDDLTSLITIVQNNQEYIGPLSGWQKLNPWSKARQVQADIDRVKQTVGKALEGGVLRKEDEDKYKKILATMLDTPETALYKLQQIYTSVQGQMKTYKSLQQSGGRSADVTASLQKKNTNSNNDPLGIR